MNNKKINIGVIFGGLSVEHEVSLQSAKNIVDSIDKNFFEVVLLGIDKNGKWYIHNLEDYLLHQDNPEKITLKKSNREIAIIPGHQHYSLISINQPNLKLKIDVIFPIVHGNIGEDGSLQGFLKIANLPFVGSNVLGSAISMDKDIAKRLLLASGLSVTPFITLTRNNFTINKKNFFEIKEHLGLPLFVKPANQGSSVGVSQVIDYKSFNKALTLAFHLDNKILLESKIIGREIECAILGNENPQASVCGEVIILTDNFYTYNLKYKKNSNSDVKLVIPADISYEISEKIRNISIQAFKVLNCTGMARIDFFLTSDKKIFLNEVNTSPGFTSISMYPKLWQASGLSYRTLINKLIHLALKRYHIDQNFIHSITYIDR